MFDLTGPQWGEHRKEERGKQRQQQLLIVEAEEENVRKCFFLSDDLWADWSKKKVEGGNNSDAQVMTFLYDTHCVIAR